MLLAKSKGIEAVRTLISFRRHMDEFTWDLMAISKETAKKLLLNEFTTFDELVNSPIDPNMSNVEILHIIQLLEQQKNVKYIFLEAKAKCPKAHSYN